MGVSLQGAVASGHLFFSLRLFFRPPAAGPLPPRLVKVESLGSRGKVQDFVRVRDLGFRLCGRVAVKR